MSELRSHRVDQVKKYRRELDTALLGGPDALLAFMRERGVQDPSCREALEATFHKTVTASMTLPIEYRRQSKAWLDQHQMHSLDDGELSNPASK